jgi:hypothetical protein
MGEKTTNIKISNREAAAWRDLAATCDIYIPRGIGSGEIGNAAEAIRRIGQVYQREPERVTTLLRPLLLESAASPPEASNGNQVGVELEPVEAGVSDPPTLRLPGTRTPGGEAHLVVLEFEVFRGEQGPRARPLSFLVRFLHQPEGLAKSGQHYLLRYDLAGKAVLRDWGFSPLDHVDIVGPGAGGGQSEVYQYLYQATGQWGYYWVAPCESFSIGKSGQTIRFPHLPQQMLPYLQSLIRPAIRTMDIFCEKCHGWQVYNEDLSPYWCEHIWWCEQCQRITSPEVRSKKWFGTHRCSHHTPGISTRG